MTQWGKKLAKSSLGKLIGRGIARKKMGSGALEIKRD